MSVQEAYDQGFALRCEGRYGEAKVAFLQAIALDPTHRKSKWQLALIQGFEGDFDGSLESLKQLADVNPSDIDVLYDLGMTYNMLGYSKEACDVFRRIIGIDPTHENTLNQIKYC